MASFLVTGGTGTLGRHVVNRLVEAGQEVRVATRRRVPRVWTPYTWARINYRDPQSVDAALSGVCCVVHCAGADAEVIASARRVRVPHLVYISIVGVDRVPFRYYQSKLAAEAAIERSAVPFTILRATQFHDFVYRVLDVLARSPLVPVPAGTSFQPVDPAEVAARLADFAMAGPAGRVDDFGGPEIRSTEDLARAFLHARGSHSRIVPLMLPGATARGYREGGQLAPDHAQGRVTFDEYLARRLGPATLVARTR